MPAAPVETPSPRRSHGDGVAAIASRAHVREQRRGRDQRSMASVTSHGSARFLCVATRFPQRGCPVARNGFAARLGPRTRRGRASARGRWKRWQRSPGASEPRRQTGAALHASDRVEHVCQRCGCKITRTLSLHDLGDAAKNEFACSLVGLRLRAIVVPVIEGGG